MAFERPTLATIIDRVRSDIEGELPNSDAHVPYTIEEALSIALGGASHQLHGHIAWSVKQILPTTADGIYLDWHAAVRGLSRTAATPATGTIEVTGTESTEIPEDTEWQRSDEVLYYATASATIVDGVASVTVEAVDAGAAGNALAGTTLSLTSPVAGIDADAEVEEGGLDSGADEETDEALRERVLADWADPPKGGGSGDYVAWAKEISGVTRAWELPAALGPGTVVVLFARDGDDSPIPSAGEVSEVQTYIDTVKPVTAAVTVAAPVEVPVTLTIRVTPYSETIEEAITAELQDLLIDESEPGGTIRLSHLNEAISRAAGELDHVIDAPVADVVLADDELGTIGTLSITELT
jgi:uncharacterized phage protein gp47/JayE